MTRKTILLLCFLLLVLAGVIAAVGTRLRGTVVDGGSGLRTLPPASEEYGKLLRRFRAGGADMEISGTIRIYDQEREGVLKEDKPFQFCRSGRQFFSQLSYLRTYSDGDLVLELDTVHQQMAVSKAPAGGLDSALAKMPVEMLFSDTARYKLSGQVEEKGGERMLSLHNDYSPAVRVCRVYYDTASYLLRRMEIEWWKDQSGLDTAANKTWLAKVDYVYHTPAGSRPGDEMRRYIHVGTGGEITATSAYSGYQVNVTIQPIDQKTNP
jgi:hypothetical protein